MFRDVLRFTRSARVRQAASAALVVALAAEAWTEIWLNNPAANGWGGPRVLSSVLAVLAVVPLWWRVRYPFPALVATLAVVVALTGLIAPDQPPLEPAIALMICCYSVGAHVGGRRTFLLIPLITAVALAFGLSGWQTLANDVAAAVMFVLAWVIGRIIRTLRRRTGELEDVTSQLMEEREERARLAIATERARIARELHDVVAHNVSVMVIQATAANRVLAGDQQPVRDALGTIETVGRQTVDEMRRLLGILRQNEEPALSPPASLAHLDDLIAQVRAAGLPVTLTVDGTPPSPLPAGVDLSAYRIVQEALTNTLKHARAGHADVRVQYWPSAIELAVTDDGTPPDENSARGQGHGLVGMHERAALYGGNLHAGPRQPAGYEIQATLPFETSRA
jgi:signal transduction histidine kinase